MRLIDADALKEYFKTIRKYHVGKYSEWYLADVLEQQPTVNAVPIRHGEWIDEGFYADGHGAHAFRCSECGGHIIEYDKDPFCRWCGARMDGEQDE